MKVDLDRLGLIILVRSSIPHYKIFNNPLIKKAGHSYYDQSGKTTWSNLDLLTNEELYDLYLICRNSWNNES